MTVSLWQDASARERIICDVAVIGGGIVGAYSALLLREAGQDVVLLEARDVAAGATGRNAGMVLLGLVDYYATAVERYGRERARELWELTVENRRRTTKLLDALGLTGDHRGSLLLAGDADEAAVLAASARLLLEDGFAVEYLPSDPLGRGFAAGLRHPDDFTIDPVAFTQAIVRASGARLLTDSEVFAIDRAGAGYRLRSKRATVFCGGAIVATNAYAPNLHSYFVGKVTPVRAQVLATAPALAVLDTAIYANWGYEYMRQLPDGRVLLGGGRAAYRASEVGYHDTTTDSVQAVLAAFLQRHFPEVTAPVTHRWSGVMGFSPDGIPLVGRLPGEPRLCFAVGFTGHGLGIGLLSAERAVTLLRDGTSPGVLDAARLA